MMNAIQHDVGINGSQEDIFSAFTTRKGLNAWWTKEAAGDLKIGGNYIFFFGSQWDWRAEVVDYRMNESIRFRMTEADSDWTGTELAFSIIESTGSSSCLLRFEHTGWRERNDHFRRTSYCWALYLRCLKRYVENGIVTEYENRTV